MSTITKQVDVAQLAELRQLCDNYAKGITAGSRAMLSKVFHKDAIIYGSLMGGPIETLYQTVDAIGPSPDMTYHVDVVSATPTTAVLTVHLDNLIGGLGYEDNLSALKVEGKWTIVCKIYQEYKNSA